jgi:hypothetical protein
MRKYKTAKVLFAALTALSICIYAAAAEWLNPPPRGVYNETNRVLITPEAERPLGFVVLGLWPSGHQYYFLPDLNRMEHVSPGQKRKIMEQFYWLNFEFSHGDIIQYLPAYTDLYVALPDRNLVKESEGNEKEYFIGYLKAHCNFSDNDVKKRVHFFYSAIQLEWAQDSCKIIGRVGRDEKNRVMIAMSEGDMDKYVVTVRTLAKTFPDVFSLKQLGSGISGEGGDEDIAWTPDNKVALFCGRHRVTQYVYRKTGSYDDTAPVTQEQIEEARKAYSEAFFGLPVYFVPEKILLHPELGSKETFHFDMFATMLPNPGKGRPRAFIPTYKYLNVTKIFDSVSNQEIDKDVIRKAQSEYDEAASQFKKTGYEVVRLPFSDHPVRNPVNIVKFHDKDTGEYTVMLAKYPDLLPMGDPNTPQARIQKALDVLAVDTGRWQDNPDGDNYNGLLRTISGLWETMDLVAKLPNPIYDMDKKLVEKYGYRVITVPSYAWGAGGLHCQLLY